MSIRLLPTVVLSLSLAFAVTPGTGRAAQPQGGQDDADTLMTLDREFDTATARDGAEGWVRYFAENGSMVSATSSPTTGREAIRKAMVRAFSDGSTTLRWTPTKGGIFIPGKLGYTVGRYEERSKDTQGKKVVKRGTYTTLWMKQADRSWKIIFDTGSADGPPEPAE